ncbi:MAG TPA: cellulose-binding protein [Candidatus Contendobacter sp.]|nr:cellulose-binding protein [Candidatus Contendobacter sp.]HSA46968.1 cellulose-binding protein [Candidatus Competibacteraceae bacterium]
MTQFKRSSPLLTLVIALWTLLGYSLAAAHGQSPASASDTANARSPLGINIDALTYWSTEWPLLDEMKRSSDWLTQCSRYKSATCAPQAPATEWDTREQSRLDLDPEGWIRSLPAADDVSVNYRTVATLLLKGNGGAYPSGLYTVLYDGEGTIEYGFDAVKNAALSQPGRDVLTVKATNAGILLRITATDPHRTGNYLRRIRVIRPGGVCVGDPFAYAEDAAACQAQGRAYMPFTDLEGVRRFHPLFLSDLRLYRAIRFMDFFRTNTSELVEWAERPRLEYARWSSRNGAPVELALELATTLDADPWINIPVRASDDYVVQFARLARERLPLHLRIYVEYANEVWNDQFSAGAWVQQQAVQRWPDQPGGPSPFTRRINGYGKRSAELCSLWKREWGSDSGRVVCVMGGMSANSWVTEQALKCPLWAAENGGHPCAEPMDALAIAPYFGGHLGYSRLASAVAAWTAQPDGGLALLFQELVTGDLLNDPKALALPAVYRQIAAHRALADRYRLGLFAYEGGQHLVGVGSAQNDERLEKLFTAANRAAAMGALYDDYLNGWRQAGGQLFMHFNSASRYTRYGSWGAKEFQTQSAAPKHAALLRFIANQPCWWLGCR